MTRFFELLGFGVFTAALINAFRDFEPNKFINIALITIPAVLLIKCLSWYFDDKRA